jgi:hypothetical protein
VSALEAPSEILLVALFKDAARAESAVESLWRRGFDSDRMSLLAREPGRSAGKDHPSGPGWRQQRAVSAHLWFRFQRSAVLRLPELGRLVALGPLAEELVEGPAANRGAMRLPLALRRLGLSGTDAARLERALQEHRVLFVAEVPRADARDWAGLLKVGGAESLTAHLRLEPWPVRRRPRRRSRGAAADIRHDDTVGSNPDVGH